MRARSRVPRVPNAVRLALGLVGGSPQLCMSSTPLSSWAHPAGLANHREARSGEDLADQDDLRLGSGRIPKCVMYLA